MRVNTVTTTFITMQAAFWNVNLKLRFNNYLNTNTCHELFSFNGTNAIKVIQHIERKDFAYNENFKFTILLEKSIVSFKMTSHSLKFINASRHYLLPVFTYFLKPSLPQSPAFDVLHHK